MNNARIGLLIFAFSFGTAAVGSAAQPSSSAVAGHVSISGPDGQPILVPGVTLTLACDGREPITTTSNEQGEFAFADVRPGTCSLAADLQGFKSAETAIAVAPHETAAAELQLGLDTLREEVTVKAQVDVAADTSFDAHVERLDTQVLQRAPAVGRRFQDALPLVPGVVRGPDGLLNVNGARSNQAGLMFNNANGTDPVTGEDATDVPIDAVSSVQVRGAAYAPEYGLTAGAVTTVETQKAGETWHIVVNDLEPRLRRRGGEFKGIESFTPRVTVGGPILNQKLTFLQSTQYEFSQTQVFGLPPFESDTKVQSVSSFSRFDWLASPTDRFTGSLMVSPRKTTFAGLNTFNPQSVTPNIKNQSALVSGADEVVIGATSVFDTRVSVKQFDSTIYPSQGSGPMILAPDVNAGSYFNSQDRNSVRAEWVSTFAFMPIGPSHLFKVGAGATYEKYDGVSASRPVEIVRADGSLSERIAFAGAGGLDQHRSSIQAYAQDSWSASSRVTMLYGGRLDYDSIAGELHVAPRGSINLALSSDGRTVVRAGAGLFYNPVPLNVASFGQFQRRVVSTFALDGLTETSSVDMPNVFASDILTPRSLTWNVEMDREWVKNFFVRVGYQQRTNEFEPIVDQQVGPPGAAATVLRTDGQSRYREAQITARYQLGGSDQIVASYTRSSAVGNLNAFNDFFGNVENPVIRPDQRGPLPWDAPHRVLLWSNISLPGGFAIFPVLDVRSGFPLSNLDADRNFVGARNEAGRFPTFVSLDTQLTKKLRVFHRNAIIGLKVFNVTNHFNPRDYQGNLASVEFGGFNNSVGRTFRGKWVLEF